MSRKKIIAGNWKMNMTPSQAVKLCEELKPLVANDDVDVVYCVLMNSSKRSTLFGSEGFFFVSGEISIG